MWNDIPSCQALTKWTISTYSTVRYSSHSPSKNKCKQIISKQARWVNGFELNWWFIMLAIIVVMNQHWTIQRSIHFFPQQQRVNPISIHHSLPVHSIDCMLSSSAKFRLAFLLYCWTNTIQFKWFVCCVQNPIRTGKLCSTAMGGDGDDGQKHAQTH